MPTATLIVNPAAGGARLLASRLPEVVAVLAEHGYRTDVVETSAAKGSACELAREAAKSSALVLACGGDGTVHGVVQGLAQTRVVLGILPVGTANALARSLKLPLDPVAAVRLLMTYRPRLVPLGRLAGAGGTRWFCLMAGCGPAGALVNELAHGSELKRRFGRIAYYAHAARLFVSRTWPAFRVEFREAGGEPASVEAVAMMACWVPDLGGLFSGVTHRASVMDWRPHVQIVRGPAWLTLPLWMLFGARCPWGTEVDAQELACTPISGAKVYVQADAEPMGVLPMSVWVVPDALSLLMPEV